LATTPPTGTEYFPSAVSRDEGAPEKTNDPVRIYLRGMGVVPFSGPERSLKKPGFDVESIASFPDLLAGQPTCCKNVSADWSILNRLV
jgi:hypothetical protein